VRITGQLPGSELAMRSSAKRMPADAKQPALPEGTFDRAMHAHLELAEKRIRRLYVRPRALFAEAIVAALVDGTIVEFPASAWDVEMPLPRRRRPVRIQVKWSGERALIRDDPNSRSAHFAQYTTVFGYSSSSGA
jgi:hypothetical protein